MSDTVTWCIREEKIERTVSEIDIESSVYEDFM